MVERVVRAERPVDLLLTLRWVRRGRVDPTCSIGPDGVWRATRTPDGPATEHIAAAPRNGELLVRTWGPGAEWLAEHAEDLLGFTDDEAGFEPKHDVVADLQRRLPGFRLTKTHATVESLVPSIVEQKVQGKMARRAYASLCRRFGEPAPGPNTRLRLPPAPNVLAALPSWAFHTSNVELKRATTIVRACRVAPQLERADTHEALRTVHGVGAWTAAEVALLAWRDADAVSVGDFHLPNLVAWNLAGKPRGDDDLMLEMLEPYRGHRGRVLRLLEHGARPPRYGPRLALKDISAY